VFLYPDFSKKKRQISKLGSSMGMNVYIQMLEKGESIIFESDTLEGAVMLIEGEVSFFEGGTEYHADRPDCFEFSPYVLHFSKDRKISVKAICNSELLVMQTENDNDFLTVFYQPKDIGETISGDGLWENAAKRLVRTVFDFSGAPYSNLALGEVMCPQGNWWGYIPHTHPQPEIYYYKFDREHGFGACFIDDKAYKITEGSAALIEGGLTHPQVTAPGFRMYCVWVIRHLDGNPWTSRIDDERYAYLLMQKHGKKAKRGKLY
jgi:5-deoxy-glucuronate isomerase